VSSLTLRICGGIEETPVFAPVRESRQVATVEDRSLMLVSQRRHQAVLIP
jgi:hypothetical protein